MSDPDKPRKGGFQPGNKFGKGRPKGSPNRFGPDLRAKLLAGIAASGVKKAKRAGINGKVDGTEFFIEALMENTAAASALLSKLIPAEQPPERPIGPPAIINVSSVAEGQQFSPGDPDHRVLMPFEMARETWVAYHAGVESWRTYLEGIEGHLTLKSFENLKSVPALERKTLLPPEAPTLHLVPKGPEASETRLAAALDGMSPAELHAMTIAELMKRAGLDREPLGPDDAA